MKRIAILFAVAVLLCAAPAHAQFSDIPGVPHTVIHDNVNDQDVPVFIGAISTPVEPTIALFEPDGTGHYKTFYSSSISIDWPQPPVTPANANSFIALLLSQFNGAIKNRFSIPEGGPPPCGNLACDAVNAAFFSSWVFVKAADGSTVLTSR